MSALADDSMSSRLSMANPNMSKKVHREVRFGNYILGSTLGEGEFGKVKLGWRKDGKFPNQVAIKLIKRDSIMKDSENEIKIHREINSLKLLNHPNIVNLVEVMKSGKYIGIVLEYASGGELFDYILHHKYLKENVAKKIFAQLVSGVDYMHSKGLIHRDLKLENLLLDKHRNVIISDFGFVNSYNRSKNDLMKTSCGSPCYAAPELVLTQAPYEGRKVDIWSLGVILYAMLSGYLPFDDDPENEDGSDIVRLYHYICKTPLTFPEYVTPLARDLLRKIIVPDPKKRIDINDIRNHPWLSPYANLLSIRQPEWDSIHKEKTTKDSTQSQAAIASSNKNKRFSMITETTNSSQLMSNSSPMKKQHGRSYSGSGQFYYSAPTVPTVSNVNGISTPPPNKMSPVKMQGSNSDNNSLLSSSSPYRGHTKSASVSNPYPTSVIEENSAETTQETQDDPTKTVPSPVVPRASAYAGNQPISTIIESPARAEAPFIPMVKESPLSAKKDGSRLPHATKKPRPTSYHPSNSFNGSTTSLLEFYKVPSPISIPISQFLSTSPPKNNSPGAESVASMDANDPPASDLVNLNSNMSKSTNSIPSRRNSVVTHVHVNGVLTRETMPHNEKRNSVLSYLEDKMNTLELTDSQSPVKERPDPKEDFPTTAPIKEVTTPSVKDKRAGDKSGSVSRDNSVVSRSTSVSRRQQRKAEKKAKRDSLILKEKENKENKEVKEQKKRNRFSLLSFYSTYNSSTNSISKMHESSAKPKKALEPSELNIPSPPFKSEQKRVDSSTSSRSSNSKKSNHSAASTNDSTKEASAAKKVMDFFKRKSIRIA